MSVIDVESLLAEISPEDPCGPDLSYDADYLALEEAARTKPEQQIGEQIIPAETPEWKDVRDRCLDLFGRTKDLQVAMLLALALAELKGVAGLADGLDLIKGLLERHWDHVHPQLDAEDDNDPTERLFKIASLGQQGEMSEMSPYIRVLRQVPLCESKQLGAFGYREILATRGDATIQIDPDNPPPEMSVIDAAFQDSPAEVLQQIAADLQRCADAFDSIEAVLAEKIDLTLLPDLSAFRSALVEVQGCMGEYLGRRGLGGAEIETGGDQAQGAPGAASGGAPLRGEIRTPQDVLTALDKICRYYEHAEPSSPVPLLLNRAKGLVSKDFVEIVRNLTPEVMDKIQQLGGLGGEAAQY